MRSISSRACGHDLARGHEQEFRVRLMEAAVTVTAVCAASHHNFELVSTVLLARDY